MLGQAGEQGVQRPVRVRRLRRAPDRELAGDPVALGDRAAGKPGDNLAERVFSASGPLPLVADQSVDDLADIEGLAAEEAGKLIMTARAPWFEASH